MWIVEISTFQRFNASMLQCFNASTLQCFNASTLQLLTFKQRLGPLCNCPRHWKCSWQAGQAAWIPQLSPSNYEASKSILKPRTTDETLALGKGEKTCIVQVDTVFEVVGPLWQALMHCVCSCEDFETPARKQRNELTLGLRTSVSKEYGVHKHEYICASNALRVSDLSISLFTSKPPTQLKSELYISARLSRLALRISCLGQQFYDPLQLYAKRFSPSHRLRSYGIKGASTTPYN